MGTSWCECVFFPLFWERERFVAGVVAVLYSSSVAFCLLNFAYQIHTHTCMHNVCEFLCIVCVSECDDMRIPILCITRAFGWRHQAGSSSTHLMFYIWKIASLCSRTRFSLPHPLFLLRFIFRFYDFCTGPNEKKTRIINACFWPKKKVTSHQDHLYTIKCDISFFFLLFLRTLCLFLKSLLCVARVACSFSSSFYFVCFGRWLSFMRDSWLQ